MHCGADESRVDRDEGGDMTTAPEFVASDEAALHTHDEPPVTVDAAALPGRDTTDLQTRLGEFGWPIHIDGQLGPQTFEAVRDFQRGFAWWRLLVDGYAGPKTWAAIDHVAANGGRCSPHFAYSEF